MNSLLVAPSPARAALVLAMSVAIALTTLTIVNALTRDPIAQTRKQWLLENLSAVLPDVSFDNNPIDSRRVLTIATVNGYEPIILYTAYNEGNPAAAVIELVSDEGYSGDITLLVGLYPHGEIVGVRVINHQETPGLGDNVEYRKSRWITQFESLSLATTPPSAWQLTDTGGRFDGITGATVTSLAVIRTVHNALDWFIENQSQLFNDGDRS